MNTTTTSTRLPTRDTLIEDYGHLCARASKKFVRPGLDRADLQQIAAIGLIKACDRYNPSVATPFEAFAWLFIIGELMHFVRDHERLVRAPRSLRRLEKQVQAAHESLVCELAREPSTSEVACRVGISLREVFEVYSYRNRAVTESLDALQPYELHVAAPEPGHPENALIIQDALSQLSNTERTIVLGLYANGYSQLELAERLGYSRRHVSRLHRRALKKMKSSVAV